MNPPKGTTLGPLGKPQELIRRPLAQKPETLNLLQLEALGVGVACKRLKGTYYYLEQGLWVDCSASKDPLRNTSPKAQNSPKSLI